MLDLAPPDPARDAIASWHRRDEAACVTALLQQVSIPPDVAAAAEARARTLVAHLRARPAAGLAALVHEFSLSSEEGVALMTLAEALLRIPDEATRDALIRDKLGERDWTGHAGAGRPALVRAAALGLAAGERLVGPAAGLWAPMQRLAARLGEPVLRRCLDSAIRGLGEQFVTGQSIEAALTRSRKRERQGFSYSYDMLGEAALTEADASAYLAAYEHALHAIGLARPGGTDEARANATPRPGLSIKLSGLHPRYERARRTQVLDELLPRLLGLARLARRYDVGLNIDAEESERLALSLDLLEGLCRDPALTGWDGVGFVVQAYGKRARALIDWLAGLAEATGRRLAVRLVKGAYWDSEIKRAQQDGAADYPVFTRKPHTDLSYIACAEAMLSRPGALYPQFATHNAQTLATIEAMAASLLGPFQPGQYEFQCLHGMGEPLYEGLVGAPDGQARSCRIYAPVGTHESLLAYLVRRLLENGANASFVSRIADPAVSIDDIVADPVARLRAKHELRLRAEHDLRLRAEHDLRLRAETGTPAGAGLPLPPAMLGTRLNSRGLDLADEPTLAQLATALEPETGRRHEAGQPGHGEALAIINPADPLDIVGTAWQASESEARDAMTRAVAAGPGWAARPAGERGGILRRAAALLEQARPALLALMTREAGKTLANGVGEVREAVDFLRFYADEAERVAGPGSLPLGPVLCISPWNFPLSIFTGQVAAALAAGNTVLAKPAEESPLTAAAATRLLHEAGVPGEALQLLVGDGTLGAALAADERLRGVAFTGSEPVARLLRVALAGRLGDDGAPVPLVAETGGMNALVADSSALPEQVVADAVLSAFDSAGQRCSALRLLCVATPLAERVLALLRGAMASLAVGKPDRLGVDVGPVITRDAADAIRAHVAHMAALGCPIHQAPLPAGLPDSFVAPTLIEVASLDQIPGEVFRPGAAPAALPAGRAGQAARRPQAQPATASPSASRRASRRWSSAVLSAGAGGQPLRQPQHHRRRRRRAALRRPWPLRHPGRKRAARSPCAACLAQAGDDAGSALPPGALPSAWPRGRARRFCAWLDAQNDPATAQAARTLLAATPLGIEQVLSGPVGRAQPLQRAGRAAACCAAPQPRPRCGSASPPRSQPATACWSNPAVLDTLPDGIATADDGTADHVLFDDDAAALAALDCELAQREGPLVAVQCDLALQPAGAGALGQHQYGCGRGQCRADHAGGGIRPEGSASGHTLGPRPQTPFVWSYAGSCLPGEALSHHRPTDTSRAKGHRVDFKGFAFNGVQGQSPWPSYRLAAGESNDAVVSAG